MKKLSLRAILSLRTRFAGTRRSNLHSGVSLIIAIIFVAALMLVMAGLFEVRIRVIQALGNRETEAKAQYLAQSAEELANFWAATHGVGRNTADEDGTPERIAAMTAFLEPLFGAAEDVGIENCEDTDGDNTNGLPTPCIGIAVVNRAANAEKVSFDGADYFSAPIRGTGDAAEDGADCGGAPADADNSCHWNRMYLGQTVEIPLYYEEANGTIEKLFSPANGGADEEFRLRVRTPCEDEDDSSADCDRLILYPQVSEAAGSAYRDPEKDPVLVQWSVFDGDGSSAITAWDSVVGGRRSMGPPYDRQNSEISAGRINLANSLPIPGFEDMDYLEDFTVLKYINGAGVLDFNQHRGKNSDKQAQAIGSFIAIPTVSKPTLRLSLVGQPQRGIAQDNTVFTHPGSLNDRERFDIPYLEYQFLTKESPPSGEKTLIIGWAEIGGFRKEFRKYIKRATSASGFAIESF